MNAGRVPADLQEPLMSGVTALAEQTPVCLARITPLTTTPEAVQPSARSTADAPAPGRTKSRDEGHDKGNAKHHKHHERK